MHIGSIGVRIKEKRKERKLTQPDLAKLIGKSISTIQKYENDSVEVPISVLDKIADVLGTNRLFLLGVEGMQKELDANKIFRKQLELLGCDYQTHFCHYAIGHYHYDKEKGGYYDPEENVWITGCSEDHGITKECINCDAKEPYYLVFYKGSITRVPMEELNNIQSELQSYLNYKLNELINKYQKN